MLPTYSNNNNQSYHGTSYKLIILKSIAWLSIEKLYRQVINLSITFLIARFLGPQDYGLFNYAVALTAILSFFSTLGLDTVIVKELAQNKLDSAQVIKTTLIARLIGGLVAWTTLSYLAFNFSNGDNKSLAVILIMGCGLIIQCFDVLELWFQSQYEFKYLILIKSTSLTISASLKLYFLIAGYSIIFIALVNILELLLTTSIIAVWYMKSGLPNLSENRQPGHFKKLLKHNWPLIISGGALILQAKFDQIIIGNHIGTIELGYYSTALRITEGFGFIPVIIQTALAPAVARIKIKSESAYQAIILDLYRLMTLLYIAISLPLIFCSDIIIALIVGPGYEFSGEILPLMSIRILFTNYGVAKGLFLINNNLLKYNLINNLSGAGLSLALNLLLIPKHASYGAVFSMICSYTFSIFIIDLFYQETRGNFNQMLRGLYSPFSLLKYLKRP